MPPSPETLKEWVEMLATAGGVLGALVLFVINIVTARQELRRKHAEAGRSLLTEMCEDIESQNAFDIIDMEDGCAVALRDKELSVAEARGSKGVKVTWDQAIAALSSEQVVCRCTTTRSGRFRCALLLLRTLRALYRVGPGAPVRHRISSLVLHSRHVSKQTAVCRLSESSRPPSGRKIPGPMELVGNARRHATAVAPTTPRCGALLNAAQACLSGGVVFGCTDHSAGSSSLSA